MNLEDIEFKAKVVQCILLNDASKALEFLAEYYDVNIPKLEIGLPKRRTRVAGCYDPVRKTIYVKDRDGLSNPYLILHEFYHHIRIVDGKHRGTEKLANKFAQSFLEAYSTHATIV